MSAQKNKFLIVTPSESKYLDVIREFVAKIATIAGFNEEHVNKIQLSVDEACTNVVKHAYRGMDSKEIKVQIEYDKKLLQVSVIDKGKGFDLKQAKLKDIDNHLNEFRKGGLGIHLMKILMDKVNYSVQPSKRTQVKMIKYLNQNAKRDKRKPQSSLLKESYAEHK